MSYQAQVWLSQCGLFTHYITKTNETSERNTDTKIIVKEIFLLMIQAIFRPVDLTNILWKVDE